jgi:cell division protein FtsI/penicillin-binding protein 2
MSIELLQDSLGLLEQPLPPGSVIKIFSTIAYLKDGGDENKVLFCPPTESGSPIPPTCWYRPGHGYINLTGAIGKSCDTYFSKIFTLKRFHLLLSTLQQLSLLTENEMDKLSELSAYEKRRLWVGIGKQIRIRPINLLLSVFSVICDNKLYEKQNSLLVFKKNVNIKNGFSRILTRGMRESSLTGTTKYYQELFGMKDVFGKTGTATYFYKKENYRKTHGYFLGFFPFPEPEYGILFFLLEGDGRKATEKGAQILKQFLQEKGDFD